MNASCCDHRLVHIDTVKEIRRRECDASVYCLIGEDNVEQLPQWHRFAEPE